MDYSGTLYSTDAGSMLAHLLLTKPLLFECALASNRYKLSYPDATSAILSIYDDMTIYVRLERVPTHSPKDAEVSRLTSRLEKLEATMALMDERITALKSEMYDREDYALLER